MVKLRNIEHVELWVENAYEVANRYENCFGFKRIAEAKPETGLEDHLSIILKQADAKLIITSSISGKGPVADFVLKHGDGVRDIAFAVDNVMQTFEEAVASGATVLDDGAISCRGLNHKTICAFGDVVHTFIEKNELLPFFRPLPSHSDHLNPKFCIQAIDHIAMCVDTGELDRIADFYKSVLNFKDGQKEYVETEYSGMNSRVVTHDAIKFPLQEPLKNNPSGPILEFLKLNCGPGAYHVALLSNNIYHTMRSLPREIKALDVPDIYYEQLPNRIQIQEPIVELKAHKILVDGDTNGYLMQVFTRSMHKRHTFYIEIIQRVRHNGFGSGNVRALFDAIEADQIKLNEEICLESV
jgi:4-hydroxyphenylpyruvate dioxygenase